MSLLQMENKVQKFYTVKFIAHVIASNDEEAEQEAIQMIAAQHVEADEFESTPPIRPTFVKDCIIFLEDLAVNKGIKDYRVLEYALKGYVYESGQGLDKDWHHRLFQYCIDNAKISID